ncbi:MAG: hypothetical protein Ct9H90mP13_06850 [Pseudomonadota bacterium]|nr:MAG: hypothetical protein Ct9H90mP13_06850 [Pseudomonadota bacterium]
MKRQIIAIGGGGFGRNPGEGIIENYILEQSDVNKPKVCFIPTATGMTKDTKRVITQHSPCLIVIQFIWISLKELQI